MALIKNKQILYLHYYFQWRHKKKHKGILFTFCKMVELNLKLKCLFNLNVPTHFFFLNEYFGQIKSTELVA